MAERFKAHAWKACEESPPQVRILFSTPTIRTKSFFERILMLTIKNKQDFKIK